jgi:hypothetical protein
LILAIDWKTAFWSKRYASRGEVVSIEMRAMTKKIADKNVSFVEEEMFAHALICLLPQSSVITMRLSLLF